MTEYNNKLLRPLLARPQQSSLTAQFLAAILSNWWFAELPKNLNSEVLNALSKCEKSIQLAISAQPPNTISSSNIYSNIYYKHRSLNVIYLQSDHLKPPHAFECAVRLRQLQMVIEVSQEIFPVYDQLIEKDQQRLGKEMLNKDLKRFIAHLGGDHLSMSTGQHQVQDSNVDPSSLSAEDLVLDSVKSEQNIEDPSRQQAFTQAHEPPNDSKSSSAIRKEIQQALGIDPHDKYLKTWQSLSTEIDLLSEELIRALDERSKLTWIKGCSSGTRLDLRRAMAFEADPQLYQSLWMRQARPIKVDPVFTLLIDTSGSMQGTNIEGAFQGLVLFTEVCARLNLPLELIAFNHDVQQIKVWDQAVDEHLRKRLTSLLQIVEGSTDLSAALNFYRHRAELLTFKDRFLVTLSDGEPNEENKVFQELKVLDRQGVHCIGVGIGPDTERLRRFFKDGVYEVTPLQVARQLGTILDGLLRSK